MFDEGDSFDEFVAFFYSKFNKGCYKRQLPCDGRSSSRLISRVKLYYYIIKSVIVLSWRRFLCPVAIHPKTLNSLSMEQPDAGMANVSLAIFAKSGNKV